MMPRRVHRAGRWASQSSPDPYSSGASPSSRSTARPMSGWRIKDSPTRMAETPAASSRSTSAPGADAALADQHHAGRDPVAEPERVLQVGDEASSGRGC